MQARMHQQTYRSHSQLASLCLSPPRAHSKPGCRSSCWAGKNTALPDPTSRSCRRHNQGSRRTRWPQQMCRLLMHHCAPPVGLHLPWSPFSRLCCRIHCHLQVTRLHLTSTSRVALLAALFVMVISRALPATAACCYAANTARCRRTVKWIQSACHHYTGGQCTLDPHRLYYSAGRAAVQAAAVTFHCKGLRVGRCAAHQICSVVALVAEPTGESP